MITLPLNVNLNHVKKNPGFDYWDTRRLDFSSSSYKTILENVPQKNTQIDPDPDPDQIIILSGAETADKHSSAGRDSKLGNFSHLHFLYQRIIDFWTLDKILFKLFVKYTEVPYSLSENRENKSRMNIEIHYIYTMGGKCHQ